MVPKKFFIQNMILSLILGLISGIFLGSFVPITVGFFLTVVCLAGIFFLYRYFVDGNSKVFITVMAIAILGLFFGAGRLFISDLYKTSHLKQFIGQKILAEGIVADEPDVRETNTKLTVRLSQIYFQNATTSVSEKILVSVPLYPVFSYGDKVKMDLKLDEPKLIDSEGGRVFDYKSFLRVRGIWYVSRFTQIKLVSHGHGAVIKDLLFKKVMENLELFQKTKQEAENFYKTVNAVFCPYLKSKINSPTPWTTLCRSRSPPSWPAFSSEPNNLSAKICFPNSKEPASRMLLFCPVITLPSWPPA